MHHRNTYPIPDTPSRQGWPWTEASDPALFDKRNNWPKISIITPSYNQGHYLEQTIRSVLLQNYPNLEYIIIDGGSIDNSVEIIQKYSPWISYWISQPDNGQSQALEKGFKKASGEISAWINSDDYYEKDTFYKIAAHYQQHRFPFLCGACQMIDPDQGLIQQLRTPVISYWSLLQYWKPHFCPPQPSIFFRTDILRELDYFDTSLKYAMDFDLWLKASKKYRFYSIPDNLSYYRVHPDSKTGSTGGLRKFIPEWKRVIARSLHHQSPITRCAYYLSENVHTLKHSIKKRLLQ